MNKLGLIGGVGPESSIEYYRLIIEQFRKRLETKNYPEMVIHSIDMTEMLDYVFSNQLERLVDFLAERIMILEKSGADFGAIASNTPHIVFDQLAQRVHIPMISIVEETCRAIGKNKFRRVGLFGTKSTMTSGFYHRGAKRYGIDIVTPTSDQQNYIHNKYMSELVLNRIIPETKGRLIQIACHLQEEESIEGLILGGTELPLILNQSDFKQLRIFDTTEVHVESIVSKMIEN